jgi:hypothetical protein
MVDDPVSAESVEKIMSIRHDEFDAGIARLSGAPPMSPRLATYELSDPDGKSGIARITFEKLPTAVLGGLMKLPRARVVIDMTDLDPDRRGAFLALFDRTFQRGGG